MPQSRRARQAGSAAFDRLRASIEASETALKDLQREVSRDSRHMLKDVGETLKTARRNLTGSRQRIMKDLEQIEQALAKGKARSTKRATKASRSTKRATKASRPAKRATKVSRSPKRATKASPAKRATSASRPAKRATSTSRSSTSRSKAARPGTSTKRKAKTRKAS